MQKLKLDANLSIGISAYGNLAVTANCIQALLASAEGDFELILVDDCSPDNGQVYQYFLETAKVHNNTTIFKFDANLEYSGSLNCILSHASGDKVIFLSNDIYVTPTYLSEMILISDIQPNIGIVRGVSNFIDNGGKPGYTFNTGYINTHQDLVNFAETINKLHPASYFNDEHLIGDAFLTNRKVLDKIGGLDPLFYGYFADHDFGLRAQIAGFELVVAQGAFAYHHRQANFDYLDPEHREQKLNTRWARIYENWARFKMKYHMPVNLPFVSTNESVNWVELCALGIDPYINPGNYLAYKVIQP